MTTPTVAAIDCGTNSTRLLVRSPDGTTLERLMRITRLGKGVDAEPARFHQREFGGDEECVRGKEEDRQQQIDDGGTHLAAMMSASMGGGLVRKR